MKIAILSVFLMMFSILVGLKTLNVYAQTATPSPSPSASPSATVTPVGAPVTGFGR